MSNAYLFVASLTYWAVLSVIVAFALGLFAGPQIMPRIETTTLLLPVTTTSVSATTHTVLRNMVSFETITVDRWILNTVTFTRVHTATVTRATTLTTTQVTTVYLTQSGTATQTGTTTPGTATTTTTTTQNCDPSYPDVCIPPPPPDLDCGDIPNRNFKVLPPDPHRFDPDGDGIGCEA